MLGRKLEFIGTVGRVEFEPQDLNQAPPQPGFLPCTRASSYVALVYSEQPIFTQSQERAPHKSQRHISELMLSTT